MLLSRASLAFLLSAAMLAAPAFATPTQKKSTTTHSRSTTTRHSRKTSSKSTGSKSHRIARSSRHKKIRGQQAIAPERVSQIQQALIREHYLTGEPSGEWDGSTVSAMQKFQADQGWQTKLMPDSRALKKLGLGPDYSNAINADGSSFAPPKSSPDIPPSQASGFAEASGVNH